MSWAKLFFVLLVSVGALTKDEETNEVSPIPTTSKLDGNLRKALLQALTELENEENEKLKNEDTATDLPHLGDDKIIQKASASALSFYAESDSSSTILTTTEKADVTQPLILIQKSNGIQHKPITTIENEDIDPFSEPEQILTSASSSFTSSDQYPVGKIEQDIKSFTGSSKFNSLANDIKTTTKAERPVKFEATTITTTTSTEESEAKVEDVQFFSAPLVAAFTVHQDEQGLPKKVEPIYKTPVVQERNKEITQAPTLLEENKAREQQRNQQIQQEQFRNQLVLQEKQRALEEEVLRLRQQQQQQDLLIQQQQLFHEQQLRLQKQKFLEQQSHLGINEQHFVPIVNPGFNQFQLPTTQPARPFKNTPKNVFSIQPTTKNIFTIQPSITFDPIAEAGKLPLNAQHLPIKEPIDFRSPLVETPNFQQFTSIAQQNPPTITSFPSFNFAEPPPSLSFVPPHNNRFFRHESGTGNFLNSNFNRSPTSNNHVTIQKSVQPPPVSSQSNRFFRSNLDSSFSSPINFGRFEPPAVNNRLNTLLYNSGFIRGKQQEDLNIVSKVLSLNHLGGADYRFASSNVSPRFVPAPFAKKT